MRYWIDWLLRESIAVIAINALALGGALLARRFGARPDPTTAAVIAASAFLMLTVLNVASARRHAEPSRALYWPGFALYEALAVAAGWAIWSSRLSA